jgi:uncharacterized membrane-anchored protein YitT (DUF2179 family)
VLKFTNYFKKIDKKEIAKVAWKTFQVLFGTFLLAFGTAVFLVPFDIVSGGISGIAIILTNLGYLSVDIWSYIFYRGLFVIGLFVLGMKFTLNTLISTVFYPLFMSLILRTNMSVGLVQLLVGDPSNVVSIVDGVINVATPLTEAGRLLIIALFGGALVGVGCGITFIGGGSTGGVDIISFTVNKYTGLDVSIMTFIVDFSVIIIGIIVDLTSNGDHSASFLASLVGIISSLTCSVAIEYVYNRKISSYVCDVITSKTKEINDFVRNELDRSTTIFDVTGGYTSQDKKMVRIVFSKREYIKVKDAIAHIDPSAFMMFYQAKFVGGEGFNKNIPSTSNSLSYVNNFLKEKKEDEKKNGK